MHTGSKPETAGVSFAAKLFENLEVRSCSHALESCLALLRAAFCLSSHLVMDDYVYRQAHSTV